MDWNLYQKLKNAFSGDAVTVDEIQNDVPVQSITESVDIAGIEDNVSVNNLEYLQKGVSDVDIIEKNNITLENDNEKESIINTSEPCIIKSIYMCGDTPRPHLQIRQKDEDGNLLDRIGILTATTSSYLNVYGLEERTSNGENEYFGITINDETNDLCAMRLLPNQIIKAPNGINIEIDAETYAPITFSIKVEVLYIAGFGS